jgi:TfoX/Sxy family transcriptional regulator of competence genes
MAFDNNLADRIRKQLAQQKGLTEKRMFGGIGFLLNGNMCCGVLGAEVIIRFDPEQTEKVLTHKHTRIFDFSGRPMKGWIFVGTQAVETESDLKHWLQIGLKYAKSLPSKK